MSNERSEEQIFAGAPIVVQLGEKKYELAVLPIGKAILWRQKLIAATQEISKPLVRPLHAPWWQRVWAFLCFWRKQQTATDFFFSGLGTAFIAFPERVLDLIFAYAPDLPRKKIMDTATEEEVFVAFSAIMQVANPLRRQISLMHQVMTANPSPSASSTSSSSQSTDSRRVM
jgi:hypothetical protein